VQGLLLLLRIVLDDQSPVNTVLLRCINSPGKPPSPCGGVSSAAAATATATARSEAHPTSDANPSSPQWHFASFLASRATASYTEEESGVGASHVPAPVSEPELGPELVVSLLQWRVDTLQRIQTPLAAALR
jgi:hypothetical protein